MFENEKASVSEAQGGWETVVEEAFQAVGRCVGFPLIEMGSHWRSLSTGSRSDVDFLGVSLAVD